MSELLIMKWYKNNKMNELRMVQHVQIMVKIKNWNSVVKPPEAAGILEGHGNFQSDSTPLNPR